MNNAFVINLDSRKKQFKEVQREFLPFRIECERFSAIRHERGALGCTLSHLALIARAKEEGWPWVMVLEDDCVAREAMKQWPLVASFLQQQQGEWDVFFGGLIFMHPIKKIAALAPELTIIEGLLPLATHFMIYHQSSYDRLLAWHHFAMPLDKKPAIDIFIQLSQVKTWTTSAFLAWQKPHFSDVLQEMNDCTLAFKRAEQLMNAFLKKESADMQQKLNDRALAFTRAKELTNDFLKNKSERR
ncbi:MAG: hypothetical protein K2W97_01170 [Chthoniobacterales bacterium]|nr:hypothetical protein [Chthoniobacterales bacterium]